MRRNIHLDKSIYFVFSVMRIEVGVWFFEVNHPYFDVNAL